MVRQTPLAGWCILSGMRITERAGAANAQVAGVPAVTTTARIPRSRQGRPHSSKSNLQTHAMALCLLSTGLKGTSSMKIHRDQGVTQTTAWFLAHHIRKICRTRGERFSVPVEIDDVWNAIEVVDTSI